MNSDSWFGVVTSCRFRKVLNQHKTAVKLYRSLKWKYTNRNWCRNYFHQGRNHGIDIGGVQMWALPQIFFLRLVADQIVKTNRPVHQRMNRGLSMEWEVRELLGLWLQQLFSLFSGYNANVSYLAVILSHLNVILFHIYSKISAVFLTMALLFRCLLAYRLKKRRMSACSSCFFLLAPTFISFKHQWQSDWAVFSNDAASRRLRAQPSVQSRGVVTPFCFPCFS